MGVDFWVCKMCDRILCTDLCFFISTLKYNEKYYFYETIVCKMCVSRKNIYEMESGDSGLICDTPTLKLLKMRPVTINIEELEECEMEEEECEHE